MRQTWAAVVAMALASVVAPRAVQAQNAPAAPAPPPATAPTPSTSPNSARRSVGSTVQELRATLSDPTTSSTDRLDAARRLVARQSPDAREALSQVMTAPTSPAPARVAALRALADDPNPDPGLVRNLGSIAKIDADEKLVTAAAQALGAYKNNPEAVRALTDSATDAKRPQPLRSAAIRGLGLVLDREAAATLVGIVTNPNEPAQIVFDAADALVDLTGLEANGRDPAKWRAWQQQNANLAPADWKAALTDTRASREQRLQRRMDELIDELQVSFEDQYDSTPPAEKPARLLKFLRAATPDVRRIGARIANKAARNFFGPRPNAPEVQERLEDLVADADSGVRLDAVEALEPFIPGERGLTAIGQQLAIETDARVKAAMARTLSRIPGIAQVRDLNRLLDDPSPLVIREAADGIRRASDAVAKEPELKIATVQKLSDTIKRLLNQPAFIDARRYCAEALAKLDNRAAMDLGQKMLQSPQPDLRGGGLTVLGELGEVEARVADSIMRAVDRETGQDPASVRVRLRGMEALARARNFDLTAEWLSNKFNPRGSNEPKPEVRDAARAAYLALLPNGDTAKLLAEASRLKDESALRVEVLKVLVKKFHDANQLEDEAFQQESLGEEYSKLGRYADAVVSRQAALNYHLKRQLGAAVTLRLVQGLTDAMLQTQQYTQLAAMAQNLFSKANEQDLGPYKQAIGSRVRNELYKLQGSEDPRNRQRDWENARKLIDAISRMDPPLARSYLDEIRAISAKVEEQLRRAGVAPATEPASR